MSYSDYSSLTTVFQFQSEVDILLSGIYTRRKHAGNLSKQNGKYHFDVPSEARQILKNTVISKNNCVFKH